MVYPESLKLDQVSRKELKNSTASWCSEPLDGNGNNNRNGCEEDAGNSRSEKERTDVSEQSAAYVWVDLEVSGN